MMTATAVIINSSKQRVRPMPRPTDDPTRRFSIPVGCGLVSDWMIVVPLSVAIEQ